MQRGGGHGWEASERARMEARREERSTTPVRIGSTSLRMGWYVKKMGRLRGMFPGVRKLWVER